VTTWRLTADGAFTISGRGDALEGWLSKGSVEAPHGTAHLEILAAPLGLVPPAAPSTLSLLDVACWIHGDAALLHTPDGASDGSLDLGRHVGRVGAAPDAHLEPLLTIATALLLGRLGRALVHAAGVVAPGGDVWLLVGDTHAGKSTTTATLVRGGWGWIADDQVVLSSGAGGVIAEGWPRTPNLDADYAGGRIAGRRVPSEFAAPPVLGPQRIAGVLLPTITPDQSTSLAPATAADVFTALVRQSPWLLADREVAPAVTELLRRAASLPVHHLGLGRDSYARPEVLSRALAPLVTG
jgi:hypothetical protein